LEESHKQNSAEQCQRCFFKDLSHRHVHAGRLGWAICIDWPKLLK
jgi:hypothetical protein